jgi:hypothetical protein
MLSRAEYIMAERPAKIWGPMQNLSDLSTFRWILLEVGVSASAAFMESRGLDLHQCASFRQKPRSREKPGLFWSGKCQKTFLPFQRGIITKRKAKNNLQKRYTFFAGFGENV